MQLLLLLSYLLIYVENSMETIHMSEINTLTLRKGRLTSAFESKQIEQLNCLYGCEEIMPSVMNCQNMGYDGKEFQWKCEAIMPDNYEIYNNEVTISCERNKELGDHYVYVGTCGAFFSIRKLNEYKYTTTTTIIEQIPDFVDIVPEYDEYVDLDYDNLETIYTYHIEVDEYDDWEDYDL